jgi:hypothetical protein
MRHSTSKPTKAEQSRLDRIHDLPCLCCAIEQVAQPLPTEAHHLTDKGSRKLSGGHMATIPLCSWHHRGVPITALTAHWMRAYYGPSLALHKRDFNDLYGTDRQLLEDFDTTEAA